MIRDLIQSQVSQAIERLKTAGALPADLSAPVEIADPKDPSHGDFACSWALSASKAAGKNPRELGEMLRAELAGNLLPPAPEGGGAGVGGSGGDALFATIEVAGPGFLNLRLADAAWLAGVDWANARAENLAKPFDPRPSTFVPLRLNVEFVSVNPNGPITVGSGRGAAFGSTLCNVLEAAGHSVHREYYINDGTNSEQMRQFAESVRSFVAIALGQSPVNPNPAYRGQYVEDAADTFHWQMSLMELLMSEDVVQNYLSAKAQRRNLELNVIKAAEPELFSLVNDTGEFSGQILDLADLNYDDDPEQWVIADIQDLAIGTILKEASQWSLKRFHRWYVDAMCIALSDIHESFEVSGYLSPKELAKLSIQVRALDASIEAQLVLARWKDTLPPALFHELLERREALAPAFSLCGDLFYALVFLDDPDANATPEDYSLISTPFQEIPLSWFQLGAQSIMLHLQERDLREFGVTLDTWFSEQSLHDSGKVAEAIAHLQTNGAADEKPERRKLKLAKGGVIEDVIVEEQPVDEEEDMQGNDGTTNDEATVSGSDTASGPRPTANDSGTANRQPPTANPTLWLRSTKFGDDMDRVLRRKDGRLTYISSDIAYHQDKFERGSKPDADGGTEKADKLITILGPDHHGYIARLHAVLAAMELSDSANGKWLTANESGPPTANRQPLTPIEAQLYASPEERDACRAALAKAREELEVLIFQIVRFVKDGKPAPMRKRDGNIYSLRDLMAEIGKDAAPSAPQEEQMRIGKDVARFFYLMRSHDTHMDFDIDLATKGTDENPVFYVQYAHARICSILEKADLHPPAPSSFSAGAKNKEGEPLHPKEALLIKKILDLPDEVARCAQDYSVHRLTTYAVELARTFHHFYDACRVIQPENPALQAQRLAICEATRHALRGALQLLGISAPERMERESASERA